MVATSHVVWHVAHASEELKILILFRVYLDLNSYIWLVATLLDNASTDL